MKKFGILLNLLLCLPLLLLAGKSTDNVQISARPAWVKAVPLPEDVRIKDGETKGGYYQLLVDRQYHAETQSFYGHYAAKILNEQGLQEQSTIAVTFDPSYQKVDFHTITVIRNGQLISKLDKKDIKLLQRENNAEAYIYDGRETAMINLSDIQTGDIIEYDFSIRGTNPIFQNKFFKELYWQFSIPVEKIHFRLLASSGRTIHIRHSGNTPAIEKTLKGGLNEYIATSHKIPALVFDSGTPGWYDPSPVSYISEFAEWADVIALLVNHYEKQGKINKQRTAELHKRLFTSHDTKESKTKKLLSFVQNEIRYLGLENGISAYKPHHPQDVLDQRYGDCKDKSLLLCSLLESIGVEATPALVNTSSRSSIDKYLPSPAAFDHCIVQVQLNDSIFWYDPTITEQGGLYNSTTLPAYGKALVLQKGNNNLSTIQAYLHDKRILKEYYKVRQNGEPSEFTIISRYEGFEADNQRSSFKSSNLSEVEKTYTNYYATNYPEIELRKPLSVRDEKTHFETEENYTINNIWENNEEYPDQLNAAFYPLYLDYYLQKPDGKIRNMPLTLPYPLHIEEELIIDLYEPWNVKEEETTVENDYFRFSSKISYKNSAIYILYSYELLKDHVPAKDINVYLADLDKAKNDLGYQVSYANPLLVGQNKLSIPVFILALLSLALAAYLAIRLYKQYDPAPRQNYPTYDSIGGWIIIPMIGLFISPFMIARDIISWDYFDSNTIHGLFDSASIRYNPALGGLIGLEIAFNILIAGFAVLLLALLFRKRSSFPVLMRYYLLVNAGFIALEVIIIAPMDILAAAEMRDLYSQLFRSLVGAAIWVPYFISSERVKGTFTNTVNPAIDISKEVTIEKANSSF